MARADSISHFALPTSHSQSGPVAQLAEQQTLNLLVLGSTPSGLTTSSQTDRPADLGAWRRAPREAVASARTELDFLWWWRCARASRRQRSRTTNVPTIRGCSVQWIPVIPGVIMTNDRS